MPRKSSYLTVTDQFCGAGGSSIGAEAAGVELRLALNHWELAIETHNANFPKADHECTDISAADPRRYPTTDILITSPECTNHSVAKGKARRYYKKDLFGNILIDPSEERSRATMWDVPRFAEYHDYNMIFVENVVDAAKWRLWDAWLKAMHLLGYEHEAVYFNSMFAFPTPQSRDRLYVVFWKKGNKKPDLEYRPPAWCMKCSKNVEGIQTWKKPQYHWGRYNAQYFYRCPTCHERVEPYYYAAINAVDWTIKGERIGDRKVALKPKTIERVQYGMDRFGHQALVINTRQSYGLKSRVKGAVTNPLFTQTGDNSFAIVNMPWTIDVAHTGANGKYTNDGIEPLPTQTTAQTVALVHPGFITKHYGGGAKAKFMSSGIDEPLGALTTSGNQSLVTFPDEIKVDPGFIAEMHNTSKSRGLDSPLACIVSSGIHHALITPQAFLSYYYSSGGQASGLNEAMHSVTTRQRIGVVQHNGEYNIDDLYFRMLKAHEIGIGMAFPETYKVLGTQYQKVKQYGNAVTPPAMKWQIERGVETFK